MPVIQPSMRSSNRPGWNGSSAACSSRKKLRLCLAHAAALLRVAIEGVVGIFLAAGLKQVGSELICIEAGHLFRPRVQPFSC